MRFANMVIVGAFALISGCATKPLPGKKIDEGGRFLQSAYGDYVLAQVDYPSPGVCAAELKATPWNNSADLKCGTVSYAPSLPVHGKAILGNTGIETDLHFRTWAQCQQFKDGTKGHGVQTACPGEK